jgi:hypothetical protein
MGFADPNPSRAGDVPMDAKWLPWLYQYGVGGVFFFGTLILAIRAGALRLGDPADRRLFVLLVGGFFLFLAVHGSWVALVH